MTAFATSSPQSALRRYSIDRFLRADTALVRDWVTRRETGLLCVSIATIIAGAGLYGSVIGSWRDSTQALYTGIKLPLVLLLTTIGNGLLNGMLAPLLGLNIRFKESLVL